MKNQTGVALITAILVVALAAIAAAAMLASANLAIHRASTLSDTERAWWYADGIENWVKSILYADLRNSKIDYLGEAWAKPVDYMPVDEGVLKGGIVDLQGRFNLNNLGMGSDDNDPRFQMYKQQFERLLRSQPGLQGTSVDGIAEAIHDWIDGDVRPLSFGGAEDDAYSMLVPPYRTANRLLSDSNELLAIRGVSKEIYRALKDYVCALPELNTAINVNTAPEAVLASLTEQPSPRLREFVEARAATPSQDADSFRAEYLTGAAPATVSPIKVSSEYFLLRGEAQIGSSRLSLASVVYRPQSGLPVVIRRGQDID